MASGLPYVGGLEEFGQLVLQDVWSVIQKFYLQVSWSMGGQGRGERGGERGPGGPASPGWGVTLWERCESSAWGPEGMET